MRFRIVSVRETIGLIRRRSPSKKCFHIHRALSSWSFPDPATPPSTQELHEQGLPLLRQAAKHAKEGRILIQRPAGKDESLVDLITYNQLLERATAVSNYLSTTHRTDSDSRFVANMSKPGWEYIATMWGTWASGYASVPLSLSQKAPELEHVLQDTLPRAILVGGGTLMDGSFLSTEPPPNWSELKQAAENVNMTDRIVYLHDVLDENETMPTDFALGQGGVVKDMDTPALVMYTSGTTGKPKGVVSTHRNIFHQVTDLCSSWQWQPSDVALHVLPLHHVHGVINVLSCAAYSGARLEFRPFDAKSLWKNWAQSSTGTVKPNVFMAVPTIYAKLLEAAESLPDDVVRGAVKNTLEPMRLMVSGSAALPVSIMERWRKLTCHTLLERYGMTEFAMALSNPYEPASERHPGHVGLPLPSVEVRIVDEETGALIESSNTSGELRVRGATVFKEYLNRKEATEEAFDDEGFFRTGDVAEYNEDLNSYRILGRASVDILKTGGYKLSALEIERVILEHPDIAELAILGIPDETWGERVGMICRIKAGHSAITVDELRSWCETRMANYKIPTRLLVVDEIPKNAMGKVNKKELLMLFNC